MTEVKKAELPRLMYTVGEVAQMLGTSKKSVYRLVKRGLLKCSHALRHLRIPSKSIEEFMTTTTE